MSHVRPILDCSTIPQTEPCPSCAYRPWGCSYDNAHGPHIPFHVVFGATCAQLRERRSVPFTRMSIDGEPCAIDFNAHETRTIPNPCSDLKHCVGCCSGWTITVTNDCGTSVTEELACYDTQCWACLGECDDAGVLAWMTNRNEIRREGFALYDLDSYSCQVTSSVRAQSYEYDIFVVDYGCGSVWRIRVEYNARCNMPCKYCAVERSTPTEPNKCVSWFKSGVCKETGICCTGRFGSEICTPDVTLQECDTMGGTFVLGRTCAPDCLGATNQCNCRTKCLNNTESCGRCASVSVEGGTVLGGTNIDQYVCLAHVCNPSNADKPPCDRMVFYMVDSAGRFRVPGEVLPEFAEPSRAEGQYIFAPATIRRAEFDHEFSELNLGGSLTYGLPVVNDEGYGHLEFSGFNRFPPDINQELYGDDVVGCETYCADPAILSDQEARAEEKGYGTFVGEFVPYC